MKVLYQWAKSTAQDWQETTSANWRHLPKRGNPQSGQLGGADEALGWIHRLNVQGVIFSGDHYAVEDLSNGGCRVTVWDDDPEDFPPGKRIAWQWTFLPLAPIENLGGAWDTRQSQVIFAEEEGQRFYQELGPVENTEIRPWSEFIPPAEESIRHGIWLPNELDREHLGRLSVRGFEEWTDGVPAHLVDGKGKLRVQRPFGLYNRPKGTKTFGLRVADQASGAHVVTNENQMTRDAFGGGETEASGNIGSGGSALTHMYSSASGEPNTAAWPTGTYRCQFVVSAVGAALSFGLRTSGAVSGHFSRVASDLSADLETKDQTEALFTGTGTKLATTGSVSWSSGSTGDRYECLIAASRPADMGVQTLTIQHNGDSWADGPWSAAVTTDKTYSGDAVLKKQADKTYSTDALLKISVSKTYSTDAVLRKQVDQQYGTDAILKKTSDATYSADAVLQITVEREYSVDALLNNQVSREYSADAVLRKQADASYSTDAIVEKSASLVYSTDGLLKKQTDRQYSIDAILEQVGTVEKSYSADASLKKQADKAYSADSVLQISPQQEYSADAILQSQSDAAYSVDSVLQKQASVAYSADALIQQESDASYSADAALKKQASKAYSCDAVLVSGGLVQRDVSYSVDAVLMGARGQIRVQAPARPANFKETRGRFVSTFTE